MTFPGIWGKERVFAQCHPPAFQESLLIGRGEALQLGSQGPIIGTEISKQDLPDALEDKSLHRRIEPWLEHLQVGVETAQGLILLVPEPTRQKAKGAPVMRLHLRSYGRWCSDERFRAAVHGRKPGPSSIDPDEGEVMRRGRAVTDKLHRRHRLGQLAAMPAHGRPSQSIVEV